jgi:hypothetical protein
VIQTVLVATRSDYLDAYPDLSLRSSLLSTRLILADFPLFVINSELILYYYNLNTYKQSHCSFLVFSFFLDILMKTVSDTHHIFLGPDFLNCCHDDRTGCGLREGSDGGATSGARGGNEPETLVHPPLACFGSFFDQLS